MNFKTTVGTIVALMCCLLLTNCGKDIPPGDYDAAEVGKIKKVVPGTIISIREVRLHNQSKEMLSANPSEAAQDIDNNAVNRTHGYEFVIRLNSGSIISVVQAEKIKLKNKQHILVIYGRNTRVVPDNGSDDY